MALGSVALCVINKIVHLCFEGVHLTNYVHRCLNGLSPNGGQHVISPYNVAV